MRTLFTAFSMAAACAALVGCGPTVTDVANNDRPSLVTHGAIDNNLHPAVVLIVMDSAGEAAFRCSGTVIAPRLVLTAGHCSGAPGEFSGMRVFTESDVQNGNNNYPDAGPNTIEATAWHTHPLYTSARFFEHDVGVIILSADAPVPPAAYGTLPGVNSLDGLQRGNTTRFTSVGYGLQRVNPVKLEAQKVRMFAEPRLIQINVPGYTGDFSMLLSNNASTGGTCFGDSGGPNYLGSSNVVAGVTSFGKNGSCGGTGGVFRLDRQNVLDFVNQYLP
jgi:hypothetical protein